MDKTLMNAFKLTPSQVLQREKARLQMKSDALFEVLESDIEYLRQDFGGLIGRSLSEAILSKIPILLRLLLGRCEWISLLLKFLRG
jgi:hypothetical protein